jgi:hypothetical protein
VKQHADSGFHNPIQEYFDTRLKYVELEARTRAKATKQPDVKVEATVKAKDRAWCMRTTLPGNLIWEYIHSRTTFDADTGEQLEHIADVKTCTLDDLHMVLDKPRRLRITYTGVSPAMDAETPTESEITSLRGVIAGISWCSREGRPDAAAAASIYASAFPDVTYRDIRRVNKEVKRIKSVPVSLAIKPIPLAERVTVLISDSAFDTSGKDRSQCGWIIGCAHKSVNKNVPAEFSVVGWRSKKLGRKAASSMLCETLTLSRGTGELLWLHSFLLSIAWSDYDMRIKRRRDAVSHAESMVLRCDKASEMDPDALAVMDAKSLFDSLNSEQTLSEDRRAALEVAVIRDDMAILHGKSRWIPHNFNPADCLTKAEGAHSEPLFQLLKTGTLCLADEASVLELHSTIKAENSGYLPRHKLKAFG